MERECTIDFSYEIVGHSAKYGAGVDFYQSLPDVKYQWRQFEESRRLLLRKERYREGVPPPDYISSAATIIGTVVLSSPALAVAINQWIKGRHREVTVTVGSASLTYKGPNAVEEVPRIISSLETLMGREDRCPSRRPEGRTRRRLK